MEWVLRINGDETYDVGYYILRSTHPYNDTTVYDYEFVCVYADCTISDASSLCSNLNGGR